MDIELFITVIMLEYIRSIFPIATPLLLAYFTVTQYICHRKTKKTSNLVKAVLLTLATLSSIILDLLVFSPILKLIWRWLLGYLAILCPIIITICLAFLISKYRKSLSNAKSVPEKRKSKVKYILSLIGLIIIGFYFILLIAFFVMFFVVIYQNNLLGEKIY